MAINEKVLEQLAKLIPRLASPFEGERLATLAAIERVLQAEKLDLHDVVAQMTCPNKESDDQEESDDTETSWSTGIRLPASLVLNTINGIEQSPRWLSANARDFLSKLRRKAHRFDPVILSSKQWQWLRALRSE